MLSKANRPGGTRSKSWAGLLFCGEGTQGSSGGPQPWLEAGLGSWGGVTHSEAQLAELSGTKGTATISTQGLPLRLKGSLAQGLQLLPLLLGSLLGDGSEPQLQC